MEMELTNLYYNLWNLVLFPLILLLSGFAIKFINIKSKELSQKMDNDLASKYIDMFNSTVTKCVAATTQTYVESLKKQNKFDAEAQKIAFQMSYDAILSLLSVEVKDYIQATSGDLTLFVTQAIEAQVAKTK